MPKRQWTSQWHNKPECEGMPGEILTRMTMLRRQLLLHSYLYYGANESIWEDHEWDKRSRELFALQQEHGWNINFYDSIFRHWQGQSGYWLPTNKGVDHNIVRIARTILEYDTRLRVAGAIKTPLGHIPREVHMPGLPEQPATVGEGVADN